MLCTINFLSLTERAQRQMWSRGLLQARPKPVSSHHWRYCSSKEMRIPQKPRISQFFCGRKITNIHHCFVKIDYYWIPWIFPWTFHLQILSSDMEGNKYQSSIDYFLFNENTALMSHGSESTSATKSLPVELVHTCKIVNCGTKKCSHPVSSRSQ